MSGGNVAGCLAVLLSVLLAGTAVAGCITCHSDADVLKKLVQAPKTTHAEGEG